MSMQVALLNSMMTHGARIIAGSSDKYIGGIPVVRLGDPVMCPKKGHGLNRIAHVMVNQQTDSLPLAHVGAVAACGAMIITGSNDFYVG
jgi:uncharacterized Zn-binding protein involved in type VI secretion